MTSRRIAVGVAMLVGVCAVVSAAGCGATTPATTTTASNGSRRIVIATHIGPISLLESKAKIESAYGKGERVTLKSGETVTFYRAVSIGVMYSAALHGVWYAETASPLYRTRSGVGVGSGLAALRRIGAGCSRDFNDCSLGGSFGPPQKPATSVVFYLNHKPTERGTRVVRIVMSLAG